MIGRILTIGLGSFGSTSWMLTAGLGAFTETEPSEVPVVVCVKRAQTYQPGFDAVQLYRAGATVSQTYRPGVDATQEECC